MTRTRMPVKLLAAAGGLVLALAAIAAGLLLTRGSGGPATVQLAGNAGFPAPPVGAVVYSRELGPLALALAVVPQPGHALLQASVVGPQGTGVEHLDVTFALQGSSRRGSDCGAGCYRATLPVQGRPLAAEVDVAGEESTRWHVTLPATWPPRGATALVARAGRAWRSLRSLAYRETLASDPRHSITSTWRIQAPDRLAYETTSGTGGIIIGARRWDRLAGSKHWVVSPQSRVTQPVPFWVGVADAHVLGTTTARGRAAWRISFFDPRTPAWFTTTIDRKTFRTLDLRMVTTSHFMHHVYGSFNAAAPIEPPRRR